MLRLCRTSAWKRCDVEVLKLFFFHGIYLMCVCVCVHIQVCVCVLFVCESAVVSVFAQCCRSGRASVCEGAILSLSGDAAAAAAF